MKAPDKKQGTAMQRVLKHLSQPPVRFTTAWDAESRLREERRVRAAEEKIYGKVGDAKPDGSIYLGCIGGKDWYVAARDLKNVSSGRNLRADFNEAVSWASLIGIHARRDWIVPPGKNHPTEPDILMAMFNHKSTGAFKGTYDEENDNRVQPMFNSTWYWSSSDFKGDTSCAYAKNFKDGTYGQFVKDGSTISLRLVRAVPRP